MSVQKVKNTKRNKATRSNILLGGRIVPKGKAQLKNMELYGLQESRFFLWVVSCIRKDDKELKTLVMPLQEFAEMAGISRQFIYREATNICANLMSIVVEIEEVKENGKRKMNQFNMIDKAVHNEGEGTATITIHRDMAPYLLNLEGNYTEIKLTPFFLLKTKYGQRLYEILKANGWRNNYVEYEIEELRDLLRVGDKYQQRFSLFEKYVIETATNEISEKTDIRVTYEKIKKGRKIQSIKFVIKNNNTADNTLPTLPESNSTEVEKLIYFGVTPTVAKKLFDEKPAQTVKALKSLENDPLQAKDPARWLVSYIKQEWVDNDEIKAKLKEDRKKEEEAKIKRDALRLNLEQQKQEEERSYSNYRRQQVKNHIDTLSDEEEDILWKERDDLYGNNLFGAIASSKGKERWTSSMNLHQNIEFLTSKGIDLEIVDKDTFMSKIYKSQLAN